jgi:hypothetical protein
MSINSQAFNADISTGDPTLFEPLLREDLTTLPPPFHILNPLRGPDFANGKDNAFYDALLAIQGFFKDGYEDHPDNDDPDGFITRPQFIRGAAQLITAITEGIRVSFPLNDIPGFLIDLGPDELSSLKVFSEAVASLNMYLTNPSALKPSQWQQCLCCLQVAHVSVTKDNWWAHFATANQHAAITRSTILNATIRNFSNEALRRVDTERARAWDQVVSHVVTSNPPPIDADPQISEWIEREANCLHTDTETRAVTRAEQKAQILHEQQVQVIKKQLEDDLALLCDETDKALDVAHERARQEMIDLRAQFKAERESLHIDLQDEAMRAAHKEHTARTPKCRPNPIKVSTHSRSSSIAPATPVPMEMPIDLPAPSTYSPAGEATQVVQMQLNSAPDVPLKNSPTLKADIPLAPTNVNAMKSRKCTSGQMNRLNRRCSTLTQLG